MTRRAAPLLPASLLFLLLPAVASPPLAAQGSAPGERPVLFHADAAWTAPGQRVAPAWILVEGGKVRAVTSRKPRVVARVVEVPGTVAPGIVDAWSGLLPGDLPGSRTFQAWADLRDSLPPDLPGADPELAARVRLARRAGVVAGYLAAPVGDLQAGTGTAFRFTDHDLPAPTGRRFLEIRLGSARGAGAAGLADPARLDALFESALAAIEVEEDYADKLEKYEKDLEAYQKKLEEFVRKQEQGAREKNGQQGGTGGRAARGGDGAGNGGQGRQKEEKKPQPPKRPRRPQPPARNPALALVVEAVRGERPVRFVADTAAEIRAVLRWQAEYGLRAVVAGGREADLLAEELAEARIPVVLRVGPDTDEELATGRDLPARWRALHEAGVQVALASGPGAGGEQALLLHAGRIVAAGAPLDEVWASLTTVPARILGLDASHGRLRRGTRADLLAFQGRSPFDLSAPVRALGPQGVLP